MGGSLDLNAARRVDTWAGLAICAVLFAYSRVRALFGGRRLAPLWATTPPLPGAPAIRPRRVLAIKFYGLGNIVMLLPVIQALREAHPGVEVDFLTLAENCPLLDRSRLVERAIGIEVGGYASFLRSFWRALATIRARRPDVALDFEQFIKLSTIVAFLSGAPERVGFNTDGTRRGWLYTIRVVYADSQHMSRIFMRLLRALQIDVPLRPVRLAVTADEEATAAALLRERHVAPDHFPLVAVHVGSGANFYKTALKRWPPSHFAQVCDGLVERYGAAVVLTGKGHEERELVAQTQAAMRCAAINACDRLSLGGLVALLSRCHLLVSNDTSVMHLAAALQVPVAAIFGPTSPMQYGPGNGSDLVFCQNLYCSPCLTNYNYKVSRCTDPVCVRTITAEEVLDGIGKRFLDPDAPFRAALRSNSGPWSGGSHPDSGDANTPWRCSGERIRGESM